MKHTKLADRVMELLLNGEDEVLSVLREQYKNANIISEEDEEVGFYINYQINTTCVIPNNYNATFQIGDVDGTVDDIDGAVGFVLYIKNGYMIMLEGYTNVVDKWPETDLQIDLKYDEKQRDYASLRKKWTKNNTN